MSCTTGTTKSNFNSHSECKKYHQTHQLSHPPKSVSGKAITGNVIAIWMNSSQTTADSSVLRMLPSI